MNLLKWLNDNLVWGPAVILLMLGAGIYLSIRTGFLQIFRFGTVWREFKEKMFSKKSAEKGSISSFESFATALASTLGVGNIAGVATAIVAGGPGAIFWMWISALTGMATKYAEIVLSCKYRGKNSRGETVGGPMYYLENGLRCKPLAVMFSFFCIIAAVFGIGNMTQANTISTTLLDTFRIPPYVTGFVLMVVVGMVILGGIQRIGKVTSLLVPFMGILYTLGALAVVFVNLDQVPGAFASIFREAFSLRSATGGILGYGMVISMRFGFARGVFTNEAGLGSAPIAHAASDEKNPVRQGMLGVMEVFLDTIVMCTITALVVLCFDGGQGLDGINLTSAAFRSVLGPLGSWFISISTTLFALSSLLGWSYYGQVCVEYLTRGSSATGAYRILYISAIFLGCTLNLEAVWLVADIANGLMAIPNLIGVLLLSGGVVALTKNYFKGRDTLPTRSRRAG